MTTTLPIRCCGRCVHYERINQDTPFKHPQNSYGRCKIIGRTEEPRPLANGTVWGGSCRDCPAFEERKGGA